MKKNYQFWPFNFGAIHNQDFNKAKVVILPVPYDCTVSWRAGAREGPYAIITASRYLDELFFDENGFNKFPVFTSDEIELFGESTEDPIKGVEEAVDDIIKAKKIPFLLGGEHSITFGGVKAVQKKYTDLSVLQLDAHLDLMDEYTGSRFNHACVMRRIKELKVPTVQVGIRSIDPETKDYLNQAKIKNIFEAPQIPIEKILKGLTKNVYLTVDLDVFDSSIMPSVGTPQPGGLLWYEVLNLINKLAKSKNIVAADVVELCPIPGLNAPDFLAAKLVYKIINNILDKKI